MALVLAPELPVENWLESLDSQIDRSPSFFNGKPVVLDLGALPSNTPDVSGLLKRLNSRGIRIIGTEGAHSSWEGLEAWAPLHANGTRPARALDVPEEPPAAPPSPTESNSLVIDQPVRSGQSIAFDRGDVTIIGSVASGAEVIAGGSMEAELLAIDGIYQTADDMSPALRGKPVQVWLAGEAMMLTQLD
jgi:septum site-determining protein MinC